MAKAYRAVVLGDPGAGKSTLAQKLAYDCSAPPVDDDEEFQVVPFIVPLRTYEEHKRTEHSSVVEFIYSYINENLQIHPPAGCVEFLLLTGRALVVFDGLDELLDLSRRKDMVAAVESFAARYSTSIVIATSRQVGYLEAPLNPERSTRTFSRTSQRLMSRHMSRIGFRQTISLLLKRGSNSRDPF